MSSSDNIRERIDIYRSLYVFMQTNRGSNIVSGFCCAIEARFEISVYAARNFAKHFPELFNARPRNTVFWFAPHDIDSRLELLTKVIEKLEAKYYERTDS